MLYEIFRKHKLPIGLTYLLFGIEFLLFAMLPFLLGLAIDSLLEHKSDHFKLYVGLCMVGMFLGYFRRRLDTRVFASIWAKDTAQAIDRLIEKEVEPSSIVSRSGYVRVYASFYEYALPMTVSAVTNIVISLAMICMASYLGGLISFVATVLAVIISYHFACKTQVVDREIQSRNENIDGCIIARDTEGVTTGYEDYKRLYVWRSYIDATNWILIDFISIGCEIIVMLTVVSNGHSVGTIMATLNYTGRIFQRIESVCYFFNSLKQLQIADQLLHND